MTHSAEPGPDPWRKDRPQDSGEPTAVQPVPGPFPAPPYPSGGHPYPSAPYPAPSPAWDGPPSPPYPAVDPQAPAWARQAHAQGAYEPAPPTGHAQPIFPPTQQQQPHQQPGYLPPGYVPNGYPQQGFPPPGYVGPGFPPGPYPPGTNPFVGYSPGPSGAPKPGVVTAAAVLAFVQAGFLVFGGLISFAGARVVADLSVAVDGSGLLITLGILALVAAGLLIAGGVSVQRRKPGLLIVGSAVSLGLSLWWLVLLSEGSAAVTTPLVFAVLPIISLSLALSAPARSWYRSENGQG